MNKRLEARFDGLVDKPPRRRGIVKNFLDYAARRFQKPKLQGPDLDHDRSIRYRGPDSKDAPECYRCRKEYDDKIRKITFEKGKFGDSGVS